MKAKQVPRKADVCGKCRKDLRGGALPKEPDVEELAEATLEDIAEGQLRLLFATQQRLEQVVRAGKGFNPALAGEVVRLTRAIASGIKEIRVLRDSISKDMQELSPEEHRAAMVEWFTRVLSLPQKHALLTEMAAIYRAEKDTLKQGEANQE
jgi:hypothetical protein